MRRGLVIGIFVFRRHEDQFQRAALADGRSSIEAQAASRSASTCATIARARSRSGFSAGFIARSARSSKSSGRCAMSSLENSAWRGGRHRREQWIGEEHATQAGRGHPSADGADGAACSRHARRHDDRARHRFPSRTERSRKYFSGGRPSTASDATAIEAIYEHIVAYSGLEQFIDQPLKNYSSGMQMRLGFSIAVHLQPDMLLLDEVFAVGDVDFQQRCMRTMRELPGSAEDPAVRLAFGRRRAADVQAGVPAGSRTVAV